MMFSFRKPFSVFLVLAILAVPALALTGGAESSEGDVSPAGLAYDAGSLDTTFNTGGIAIGTAKSAWVSVVQPDGKIVIGGDFPDARGVTRSGVARLNADGSLDTAFNTGADVGVSGTVYDMALQDDGKVIIAGVFETARGVTQNGVARLNTDGSLDTTFNTGADVGVSGPVTGGKTVYSVALQSNGKIVIGGFFDAARGVPQNGIARLNADGSLDTTFNTGVDVGTNGTVNSVNVQPDNKILIGGFFETARGVTQNGVARLNADGSLDTTFNTGADVGVGGEAPLTGIYEITRQGDDKIIIGGSFQTARGVTQNGIARLNTDGSLDTTFNTGADVGVGGEDPYGPIVYSALVQPNGRIVISGVFQTARGVVQNGIARLLPNGTLDNNFNTGADPGVSGTPGLNPYVWDATLQPDGKIIIVGTFESARGVVQYGLARLEGRSTGPSNVIYGIDDENVIWEIDPLRQTFDPVNTTELLGVSNSMAYDTERDQFFFIHRGTDNNPDNSLRFWDRTTTGATSVPVVATREQIGIPADVTQPANASYFNDAYWFIPNHDGGTLSLHRVDFTYVDGEPTAPVLTVYDLTTYAPPTYPASGYGDIAISNTGMLYGAQNSGRFFTIDLNLLGNTSNAVYTEVKPPNINPSLQLSFNSTYDQLYGHDFENGDWYLVDMATGDLTPLDFNTILPGTENGFRDLGGASSTRSPAECAINNPDSTNNQSAVIGTAVPNPLEVLISDLNGDPVDNVEVSFTVTSGDGSFGGETTVTVLTDAFGVAQSPAWTLGPVEGENTVEAAVGTLCELVFTATGEPEGEPSISLTKVVTSETPAKAGDIMKWLLTATNTGNVALNNVVIEDEYIDRSLACGTLEPEETCTGEVTYSARQTDIDNGVVNNTAFTSGNPENGGDPVTATAEASTPIPQNPQLTFAKDTSGALPSAKVGDVIQFSFSVTNSGNVTLNPVIISDPMLAESAISCPEEFTGSLAPGDFMRCVADYALTQADLDNLEVVNTATVTGTPPPSYTGEEPSVSSTAMTPLSQLAEIALVKQIASVVDVNGNGVTDAGDQITWTVTATNTGSVSLFSVKITDPLTNDEKDCGTMPSGETCVLSTKAHTVGANDTQAGEVVNIAAVTASTQAGNTLDATATSRVPTVRNASPASLPQTGASATGLVLAGFALFGLGGAMFAARRFLRPA